MMGFLSSMGNPMDQSRITFSILKEEEEPPPHSPKGIVLAGVDFATLPCPQIGTVLAGVMDVDERSYHF
jgi:hypothetical protein